MLLGYSWSIVLDLYTNVLLLGLENMDPNRRLGITNRVGKQVS